MSIPSYKQIHIIKEDRETIFEQLSEHQFGNLPYVLIITQLKDQLMAINNINDYIYENDTPKLPYPIYIVSNEINAISDIAIFKTFNECPRFFNQKIKAPNIKEQAILHKLHLKQKNLSNLKPHEFNIAIDMYAKGHKELSKIAKEGDFLEKLNRKLRDAHE